VTAASPFSTNFTKFFQNVSYGKLAFDVTVYPKYLHIENSSSKYEMNVWDSGYPGRYFDDAMKSAESAGVDFSKYNIVVVEPPTGITQIIYGPSLPIANYSTPTGTVTGWVVGGVDQRNSSSTGWIWLTHEVGHILGMHHMYLHSSNQRNPIWDSMDNVYITKAAETFAWSRWREGWLSDSQVTCLDASSQTLPITSTLISPVEENSAGQKLVLIKLNQAQAIAIESRRNYGFDQLKDSEEGSLVYLVDVSKKPNEGAITVLPPAQASYLEGQLIGTLQPGQSVTYKGISVFEISSSKLGDNIQLQASSLPAPTTTVFASPTTTTTLKKQILLTITCVKGKTSKKVTAVKPICPAGYVKK
jgi:M6 family metalloprotease-like protein